MKVAVSIPDDIFAQAEALARRTKQTRSRLYARALDSYVATHAPDELTSLIDSVVGEAEEAERHSVRAGARTALKHTEW